ncbi:hypothetical protein MTBBW1_2890002 [Desulfamplus magnetovallimortis]|uniref:Uncharacterized protein n=1 Tax=Desulfamplus magnetovallimortis TaxID=1246637 RepID=A0A1W1HFH5_9BACT|nr:hypothetical protein MTBBW1_2890002 [Desulfamplus magnetovallimortis]
MAFPFKFITTCQACYANDKEATIFFCGLAVRFNLPYKQVMSAGISPTFARQFIYLKEYYEAAEY